MDNTITYINDLNNLCQPLFQNTKIDSFNYIRAYQDGSYISLNTNYAMEKFMLTEDKGRFMHDVKILDAIFNNKKLSKIPHKNKLCLFTEDIDRGYWANMFKIFNVKSCFNIVEKNGIYYERFGFSSSLDKPIYTFYLNHIDILEKFIWYFREYGNQLIKEGEKNKVIWFNNDADYCKLVQDLTQMFAKEKDYRAILAPQFRIKKYPVNNGGSEYYLTSHEVRCLQYLGHGFTCKEIGNMLQISHRTVEGHLRNIKNRLDIQSHNQLLKMYHASELANLTY